jgi:hypothetical protein
LTPAQIDNRAINAHSRKGKEYEKEKQGDDND